MRVVAGKAKGIQLVCPPGLAVRPPSDRMKEAVFNILGQEMAGLRVLDLFAGTGSFGIEALSRGALYCIFIEQDREAIRWLKENLARASFAEGARVIAADALNAPTLVRAEQPFSLIFIDPPYRLLAAAKGAGAVAQLMIALGEKSLVTEETTFILHRERKSLGPEAAELHCFERRRYGRSVVEFFRSAHTRTIE